MINQKTIAILPTPELLRILCIGCGAIGSWIINLLVRLGIEDFTLWDFDKIVMYNVGNQWFIPKDEGKYKVDACKEHIKEIHSGAMVRTNAMKFDGTIYDPDYVFMAVDSMKARKEIAEDLLNQAMMTGKNFVVIDCRMNLHEVSVYSFHTGIPKTVEAYKKTLYDDSKVLPEFKSVCGTVQGLGTISTLAAAMAVQKLIQCEQGNCAFGEDIINMQADMSAVSFTTKYKKKDKK